MCLNPIPCWHTHEFGVKHKLHFKPSHFDLIANNGVPTYYLPCGKCQGCLEDKVNRWVNRLVLESDSVDCGTFVTLTYADAPDKPSKRDLQLFLKRLRHASRDYGVPPFDFRYFAVAEHGGLRGRVHYHALLFGVNMLDMAWKPFIATFDEHCNPVLSSKILERIWNKGFVTVGEITSGRCRYIAKYMLKQDGQEDNFCLKSMRLGVRSFFDIERKGKSVIYKPRFSDSVQRLKDGFIHVTSDKGKLQKIRIPAAICNYLEHVDFDAYLESRFCRSLEGIKFSKNFDIAAYKAVLKDKKTKQQSKRRINHE